MTQNATSKGQAIAAVEEATAQYLTFSLHGEMFAVGILNVEEIIEYGNLTANPIKRSPTRVG